MSNYFQVNEAAWDRRTHLHKDSQFYDLEGFKHHVNSLNDIELEGLGDVSGKTMLHLQCHFGQDSLSWAKLGAMPTGVDLSGESIRLARQLNDELGLHATFVQANIMELDQHLNEQFDLVFTSYGAILWLPDLNRWASLIRKYLKPGGIFYMAEFHPVMYMFNFDRQTLEYDYFNRGFPYYEVNTGTYAEEGSGETFEEYFWQHSMAEVIQALIDNGLKLLDFREFDYSPYNCFPNMKETGPGKFQFGNFPCSIPHVFSLKCTN